MTKDLEHDAVGSSVKANIDLDQVYSTSTNEELFFIDNVKWVSPSCDKYKIN